MPLVFLGLVGITVALLTFEFRFVSLLPFPPPRPGLIPLSHAKTTTPQERNRTLYVMVGQVRGAPWAWESQLKRGVDALDADLALLVTTATVVPPDLRKEAKYVWAIPEYEDWGVPLDEAAQNCAGSNWRSLCDLEN